MDRRNAAGFSLVELVVATAVGLVVMASAVTLFQQGIETMHTLAQRAEMQQNARVGINWMSQEISLAATGIPIGGIQLPTGAGSGDALFTCDQTTCYLMANNYPDDRLYGVNPGDGLGPTINGVATDVVVVAYDDVNYALDQLPLVSATTTQIQVNPATNPPIDDPAVGIQVGDVLSVCNTNGCAATVVTAVNAPFITLANGDPLNFNQPAAGVGNLAAILDPPAGVGIPATVAKRIFVITYFIDAPPGPDGVVDTGDEPSPPRLMRQVNAHPPVPVAESVENLQIQYDIFDDTVGLVTASLDDAGGFPNQIRKATIAVSSRSPQRGLFRREYERITLTTSVTPRNMSFLDRYE